MAALGPSFLSLVWESTPGLTCSSQALAEQLLGESVVAVNFQYFRKPPGGLATPPHQVSYVPIVSNDEDMPIFSCSWFSMSLPLGTFEERHRKSVPRVADDKHNVSFRKGCALSSYQEIKSDMDWNSGRVLLHVGATRESHYPLAGSG